MFFLCCLFRSKIARNTVSNVYTHTLTQAQNVFRLMRIIISKLEKNLMICVCFYKCQSKSQMAYNLKSRPTLVQL